MRRLITSIIFMLAAPATVNAGLVTFFTDQQAWTNAVGNITNVGFVGSASDFGDNTSGNPIGPSLALDVNGTVTDKVGLTGTGQLEFEVASTEVDEEQDVPFAALFNAPNNVPPVVANTEVSVRINTPSIFGFALFNLTNDSTNPPEVPLHELAIAFDSQIFLISDVLGLTSPQDFSGPDATVPFLGFVSTDAFDSFEFVHGDRVRPVAGNIESYWLDGLSIAEGNNVPAPATLALLGLGLLGLGFRQRRKP